MSSTTIYGALPATNNFPFHYLYRITNLVEQKHYYGIRTSKTTLPHHDLGVKYFSSSVDKNFKKDQKEHPENYKYKIIIVAYSRKRVADLEIKLHNKFNVGVNPKFYNRAIQSSAGFDASGRIAAKDNDGNIEHVSITDERYLKGDLKFITSGKVSVRDEFGNTFSVSVTDERYLSGELKFVNSGKVAVRDEFGNTFSVSVTDERYLNGELKCVATGRVVVKDEFGNISSVSVTDERYLNGELVHISTGRKRIFNPELKKEMMIDPNTELPLGWFYGRLNSKMVISVPKGSKMIHNIELKQNKFLKPDEEITEGWEYGQKRTWD